jgi:hypothetical protein
MDLKREAQPAAEFVRQNRLGSGMAEEFAKNTDVASLS